jgi:predicted nuclease of restriction endonuclease-like (RecB) superfamily
LGVGFAFVGSQYRLVIGNEEFFIDLLFYHLKLRAYVVVDLLCGRPHNRSSVAQRVMWRRDGEATSACRVANLNAT